MPSEPTPPEPSARSLALSAPAGLGPLFAALGQALLVLDAGFRVLASYGLAELASRRRAREVKGKPIHEVLRAGLFGPGDPFRRALEAGEHRQGWRASVYLDESQPHLVGLAAAPLPDAATSLFPDRRAAYAVMLKPVGTSGGAVPAGAPTAFAEMVARSAPMLRLFEMIQNLHESTVSVLVTGESGAGKELVARALHRHSPRREGAFVAINCGAFPDTLLESELFGHVRGAFSGAVQDRVGRFEQAGGGTLFLDEVGDLPLQLQVKLLRVLQERTFERLGENRSRHCDARFVAATHRDLRAAIAAGNFREDLYYRLHVVELHLPPLRDRPEDIEPLADHLLSGLAARLGRPLQLSADALGALLRYSWPGNVRQLANALEHAVAVGQRATLHPEDLPHAILDVAASTGVEPTAPAAEVAPAVPGETAEIDPEASGTDGRPPSHHLIEVLQANRWRRRAAARALGVSRTTLWRWMRDLGLD